RNDGDVYRYVAALASAGPAARGRAGDQGQGGGQYVADADAGRLLRVLVRHGDRIGDVRAGQHRGRERGLGDRQLGSDPRLVSVHVELRFRERGVDTVFK